MPYTLTQLVVYFFTYAVIGWLWETVYCSIKDHHYDYRGFLFGPYCPVYGFAVTTILVFTYRVRDNIVLLFLVGIIVATLFEYFASLFLEKVFHMKLWDYSHLWGNIQGRVAPIISLGWGFGVVLLVKFVQPLVQKMINWEEAKTHGFLALIVVLVMGTDFICTIISVERFHTTTQMWDRRINEFIRQLPDKLEHDHKQVHAAVVAHLNDIKPERKLSWNQRRLLKSFPQMKFNDSDKFNKIKEHLINKNS